MYIIKLISLNNCPYSIAAEELLKNIKNVKIIRVGQNNKNKYKNKEISTFPQIYLIKNNKNLLLGGYSDIKEINDILSLSDMDKMIKNLGKKYQKFEKKILLRIIQIFLPF